ncbi:MAG: hypothetical protein V2B18_21540, partial [Pseudomonadota bacterium]
QTITIAQDVYLDKLTLSWDISYWNSNPLQTPGSTFGPNQFVAVYLYDASTGTPVAMWMTTNGVDADVAGSLAHQRVTLTASSSLVQAVNNGSVDLIMEFRVCGMEWYLDAAIDDFKLEPHRHYPAFQVNPADTLASLDTTFVSTPTASAASSFSPTASPMLFTSSYKTSSLSTPRSFAVSSVVTTDSLTTSTLTEAEPDPGLTETLSADSGTAGDVVGGSASITASATRLPADTAAPSSTSLFTTGSGSSQSTFEVGLTSLQSSMFGASFLFEASESSAPLTDEPLPDVEELTPLASDESVDAGTQGSQDVPAGEDGSVPEDAAQAAPELLPQPTIVDQLLAGTAYGPLDGGYAAPLSASGNGPALDPHTAAVFNVAEINAWLVINAPERGITSPGLDPSGADAAVKLATGGSCSFDMDSLSLADIFA